MQSNIEFFFDRSNFEMNLETSLESVRGSAAVRIEQLRAPLSAFL
jgi:hypothetical protein